MRVHICFLLGAALMWHCIHGLENSIDYPANGHRFPVCDTDLSQPGGYLYLFTSQDIPFLQLDMGIMDRYGHATFLSAKSQLAPIHCHIIHPRIMDAERLFSVGTADQTPFSTLSSLRACALCAASCPRLFRRRPLSGHQFTGHI